MLLSDRIKASCNGLPPSKAYALLVYADAAERLAVAGDVYWGAIEAYDTSENEDDWDELLAGMKSRRAQLDEALAAWRALGEVQP